MNRPIRVLVADDHEAMRAALADLVEATDGLALAGSAPDVANAIELAAREQPDVALIDLRMPGGGGLVAAHGIRARSPGTKMLAISAFETIDGLETSFAGYIRKDSPNSQIVDAIREAGLAATPEP